MNLLKDEKIVNGFKLKGLNSIRDGHAAVKLFQTNSNQPDWFLCQWNSKYNLTEGSFAVDGEKYSIWDETKNMTVYKDGTLDFSLEAGKEYDAPRKDAEPWPHLLIEQEITQNNKVRDMKKIVCQANVSLNGLQDYMGTGKSECHTVQFVWVITFKDGNPQSPSYGSFIWVVMCPFDMRYEYAPMWTEQDSALPDGEFIYSLGGREFMDKPLAVGSSANISVDLFPKLSEILAKAQSRGFMRHTKLEDLEISSTNMGFEITGTFDCNVTVKNFQINIG